MQRNAKAEGENRIILPNTREPVSDERKGRHEQEQDRRAIFGVPVDLPRDSDQTEEPRRFQQTDEGCGLEFRNGKTISSGLWCGEKTNTRSVVQGLREVATEPGQEYHAFDLLGPASWHSQAT